MKTHCQIEDFVVLHRDERLLAVHKPAGLLLHRSELDRRETRFALQMARDAVGQRVHPVHRLDRATSGLLLFALDASAAAALSRQFAERRVHKQYLALVRGWPAARTVIDRPLRPLSDRNARPVPDAGRSAARTVCRALAFASLHRALGRYPTQRYALLSVHPESGRSHQIRRHLNHVSHPVIGDVNHGDRHHNHLFHDWRGYHRLYLAAVSLRLRHPDGDRVLSLQAPLQADFRATLQALGMPQADAAGPGAGPGDDTARTARPGDRGGRIA